MRTSCVEPPASSSHLSLSPRTHDRSCADSTNWRGATSICEEWQQSAERSQGSSHSSSYCSSLEQSLHEASSAGKYANFAIYTKGSAFIDFCPASAAAARTQSSWVPLHSTANQSWPPTQPPDSHCHLGTVQSLTRYFFAEVKFPILNCNQLALKPQRKATVWPYGHFYCSLLDCYARVPNSRA